MAWTLGVAALPFSGPAAAEGDTPRGNPAAVRGAASIATSQAADPAPGAPAAPVSHRLVREYPREVAPETEEARFLRHEAVARRRIGPLVLVHRGAAAFAPENSLEACVAAVEYGADGCEVDLRRTRDGVLILYHDETLDRLTAGFGPVNQLTYRELLTLPPQTVRGRTLYSPPPTFASLLDVARQCHLLLHLDLKEAGLEPEVIRLLDAADAWDHVVHVNTENAARLLAHPRLSLLRYKAPGLYPGRHDVDPDTVSQALSQPGDLILVDDPRVAALVLGRPAYQPVAFTKSYRLLRTEPTPNAPLPGEFLPSDHLRRLARQVEADAPASLLALLFQGRPGPESILERAWAATRLGELAIRDRGVIEALEEAVRRPSPDPDWRWHGLDAAVAARALGRLGAVDAVPTLIEAFQRTRSPRETTSRDTPALTLDDWREFRPKMYMLEALGGIRDARAKRFLWQYVRLDEPVVRRWGPPQFEEATQALLEQRLRWDEIARLLRSPNSAVRGTALLECLDRYTEERGLALRRAAPWALNLPRAGR